MQQWALERLRRPACLGQLRLQLFAEAADGEGTETGALLGHACPLPDPIEGGTPVMPCFRTGLHEGFALFHRERLDVPHRLRDAGAAAPPRRGSSCR